MATGPGLGSLSTSGWIAAAGAVVAVAAAGAYYSGLLSPKPDPQPAALVQPSQSQPAAPEPKPVPEPTATEAVTAQPEQTASPTEQPAVAATQPATTEPGASAETPAADPSTEPAVAALSAPTFDLVRVEPDGTTVIAGKADAGSTIAVLLDNAEQDRFEVDASGTFVSFLELAASDAPRVLTLLAERAGESVMSAESIILAPSPKPEPETAVASAEPVTTANETPTTPSQETETTASEPTDENVASGLPASASAPKPESTTEPKPEQVAVAAPQPAPELAAKLEPAATPQPEPQAVATSEPATEPQPAPATAQDARTEAAAPVTPQPAPEAATRPQPTETASVAPDPKPAPAAETASNAEPAAPSEPPSPTAVAQPDPKTAPASGQVVAAQPDPQPQPTPETAPAASTEPAQAPVAVLRADAGGVELVQPARPAPPEVMDRMTLDTISYTEDGDVLLSGKARAGSVVRAYLDNTAMTDFDADAEGRWKGLLGEVEPGIYTLRLDELDADGKVIGRIETPFKREAPEALNPPRTPEGVVLEDTPLIRAVTVQKGDTLWAISRERYGLGVLYVRVFEANRDSIRNPDLIYPGQVFALPD